MGRFETQRSRERGDSQGLSAFSAPLRFQNEATAGRGVSYDSDCGAVNLM